MLRNYLKVALRNLWKSKGYSAINIIGLAAGLGVCLLIVLYVIDEASYDRWNPKADRVYRLDADIYFNNTRFSAVTTPRPLAYTLAKEYPQVEQMVRTNYQPDVMVKKGAGFIQDHRLVFADSTFFQLFPVPMIAGDAMTALNEPNSIVLDASAARRYFGGTNIVGKTLELENHMVCKVTGVMKDMPALSHFHFSFIRPLRDFYNHGDENDWLSNNYTSYILLRPGVTRAFMQSRIDATVHTYLGRQLQEMLHTSTEEMRRSGNYFKYEMMPVTDIHLHSNKSYEFEANGSITFVYTFSAVALLILLIACVNFMNLSTARSANRAREVGIRKVAGSTKGHLVAQFLTESVVLCFISLALALGIALLLLPMFNILSGKDLHAAGLFSMRLLPVLVLLALLVGVIAGSYPAFYLSSFQPIQVLKGKIASGFARSGLRSILVVFQFFISISLIIATLVIYRQLQYIRSRDLGFNREQVLVIHGAYEAGDAIKSFRQDLLKLSGVENATLSGDLPTAGGYSQNGWFRDPSMDAKRVTVMTTLFVDENYIPTLAMQMVKGRNFSPQQFPTDSSAIILNEAAAQMLGLYSTGGPSIGASAAGGSSTEGLRLYRPGRNMEPVMLHVIGIVKDFNYSTMHQKVGPLVMQLADNRGSLAVRLRPGTAAQMERQIEAKWKTMANGLPFSYTFMDNDFNNLYHAEQQTGQVFITFAVFAILIACLGLFGLVTFAAEQRRKEIGIRKVLGANIGGIVAMLNRDFTILVGIAALAAFPVAWWAMNRWLQSFAYRVGIPWWVFVVAGVAALAIALVTVSVQTVRAAVANPVRSLRSE
ncbi:MAG TPA: FtsX-like permease family protein [Puia sp.]|uniref:FtsX-like permease family protein n=1 Tax=Puia sp. TaxID=2045100 RepID=UPI002BE46C7F|nr:FtsX-like permease family protein [Puia sp.]HVU98037.1 FtsX-like permease family protein [Puia sp.]